MARSANYLALEEHFAKLADFHHIEDIMFWDEATMMPVGAGESRAAAISRLKAHIQRLSTDSQIEKWIEAIDQSEQASLDEWQRANLNIIKRIVQERKLLDEEFVAKRSKTASLCEQNWRRYRQENNWKAHRADLEALFALVEYEAKKRSDAFGLPPYEALVSHYEKGISITDLESVFGDLEKELPPLINQIIEKQSKSPPISLKGPFPEEQQRTLGLRFMKDLGFAFENGRLDTSTHPFCGGTKDDVRITTRYDEKDFTSAFMGILHETGHGKYEQNLPKQWRSQPVGHATGMALHESQSLFQEMQICRGRSFLEFAAPLIRESFGYNESLSLENLLKIYQKVEKSYIRVDADEATYPLHVMIRYKIERALFEGDISISDIPNTWDELMGKFLDLDTKGNFKDGCMQDVHWPAGIFGYFPHYTLGAVMAAQFYQQAKKEIPAMEEKISKGQFSDINNWQREKIHQFGSLKTAKEILHSATGQEISVPVFIEHIKTRYL